MHAEAETDDVTTPWGWLRTDASARAARRPRRDGCGWNFCCGLHAEDGISCAGSTPVGGDIGFLGLGNRRATTPFAAPGVTFPVIAPAE